MTYLLYRRFISKTLSQADFKVKATACVVSNGAALGGSALGGIIGGAIGSLFGPGPGTFIGTIFGSVIGGVVAGIAGDRATVALMTDPDEPTEEEKEEVY